MMLAVMILSCVLHQHYPTVTFWSNHLSCGALSVWFWCLKQFSNINHCHHIFRKPVHLAIDLIPHNRVLTLKEHNSGISRILGSSLNYSTLHVQYFANCLSSKIAPKRFRSNSEFRCNCSCFLKRKFLLSFVMVWRW